ncbi:MAG: patatin-like phospholipase family protein [Sphingobacteriaceae bacterium]
MKKFVLLGLILAILNSAKAQKVGLVLSGGGAKGLAHVGVLKALEENHIPIDYITGTSMGGIVGALYSAGYSPSEIEYIALSDDFQEWVNGRYKSDFRYYFKKKPDNPAFLNAKLEIDTSFNASFRANLVNDIPLNFALLQLLGQASVTAQNNFDKLFVPYRCIVADIFDKKMVPIGSGSLVEAVRGTMAVPLVYRPVKVGKRYVFDGGIYNNFPVDVMKSDFKPDYIIGVNVSSKTYNEYPKENDDKVVNRFLMYMFLANSDTASVGKNGTVIQPDISSFSATSFSEVAAIIKSGYDAAMADMPNILRDIKQRSDAYKLKEERIAFKNKNANLVFDQVLIDGINSKQQKYVANVFWPSKQELDLVGIKEGYYKLAADENFETIYPRIYQDSSAQHSTFELQVKPQKNFRIDFGGSISTRPVSNVFLGLQYNILDKQSYTFGANLYSGRFYESVQTTARMDVPTARPYYLETEFTYNHWNFYSTSQIIVDKVKPTYVDQSDRQWVTKLGTTFGRSGKLEFTAGYFDFNDRFSPSNNYVYGDIFDESTFSGFKAAIDLTKNTLNKKQYATKGLFFQFQTAFFGGTENYTPGNVLRNEPIFAQLHPIEKGRNWLRIKTSIEHYPLSTKHFTFGYSFESILSNKPLFSTYKSTLLSAPTFYPLQDSKSIFFESFRANSYAAAGVKNIVSLRKNLDLRLEAYLFEAIKGYELVGLQDVNWTHPSRVRYVATAGLVYQSPIGPISLSVNRYNDDQKPIGVMFHAGFLLYNKRSLD